MKYKILEHPADLKIQVFGKDLKELFSNAALGMANFQFEIKSKSEKGKRDIVDIKSTDLKALLIDWLSELLYLSDTNNLAYIKFDIKKLTETELEAEVQGFPGEPKDDIKAVTYHGLEIKKVGERWEAIILFDI